MKKQSTPTLAVVAPATPCSGSTPPPKKPKWNHSEQVLVWYEGTENHSTTFGIAYFHYAPPFEKKPRWVDFSDHGGGRTPTWWWPMPSIPNA